jgi:hypothetical protein
MFLEHPRVESLSAEVAVVLRLDVLTRREPNNYELFGWV